MTDIEQPPRGWRSAGGLPLAAGLIVLAVAATLLAIRAGDDDPKSVLFLRATDAATAEGSYRFTMKQGVRGTQGNQTSYGTFGMNGAVDMRAGLSRFVTSVKGTGIDVRCTQIATKDTLYTSVHPTRRAAVGRNWIRANTSALLAGASFQFRPDQLYRDPDRGFKNLKRSGTVNIRGVRTTRYAGDIDFASFFAPQRGSTSPRPTSFDIDLPAEIFVDDDGLIHRMTFEVRSDAGQGFSFGIVMEFFDYGKPVNVKLPPASAVKAGTPQETATACFPVG